jgi:hypothetical protein
MRDDFTFLEPTSSIHKLEPIEYISRIMKQVYRWLQASSSDSSLSSMQLGRVQDAEQLPLIVGAVAGAPYMAKLKGRLQEIER